MGDESKILRRYKKFVDGLDDDSRAIYTDSLKEAFATSDGRVSPEEAHHLAVMTLRLAEYDTRKSQDGAIESHDAVMEAESMRKMRESCTDTWGRLRALKPVQLSNFDKAREELVKRAGGGSVGRK